MNSNTQLLQRLQILASDRRYAEVVSEVDGGGPIDSNLATNIVAEISAYGGIEWLPRLVSLGANLDGVSCEGRTPLASCMFGLRNRYETFRLFVELLCLGANPNLPAEQGYLPLQLAIEMNLPEYAVALLAMGADPARQDETYEHGSAHTMVNKPIRRELYWAKDLLGRWNAGNNIDLAGRIIPLQTRAS